MKQPIRIYTALFLARLRRYLPKAAAIRQVGSRRFSPVLFVLVFLALSQRAQAVIPPPDGGYPGNNTAEGQNALFSLTTGAFNTAIGSLSLKSDATGGGNTAIGAGTLLANTADQNTATGIAALLSNTIGGENTANGALALLSNTTGESNTANGAFALFANRIGQENTATGAQALFSNDGDPTNNEGSNNSAFGNYALFSNTTGYGNSAFGWGAMPSNNSGSFNTAAGFQALGQSISTGDGTVATGSYNTALGEDALRGLTTGSYNTGLGAEAGFEVDTASNVICVGAGVRGISSVVGEVDNSCYIGNIYNAPVDLTTAVPVFVDQDGKLGTQGFNGSKTSVPDRLNQSLKEHRKIDEQQTRITTSECEVATQLLNEFLKEHKKVQQLEVSMAEQRRDFRAAIAELKKETDLKIQKATAQIELNQTPARMAVKE